MVEFRLPPTPHKLGAFTCLVGLIGQLARGDIDGWLREREWSKSELTSRFLKKQLIGFGMTLEIDGVGVVQWPGAYNVSLPRCTAERVRVDGVDVLKIDELHLSVAGPNGKAPLPYPLQGLNYQGSTLSCGAPSQGTSSHSTCPLDTSVTKIFLHRRTPEGPPRPRLNTR